MSYGLSVIFDGDLLIDRERLIDAQKLEKIDISYRRQNIHVEIEELWKESIQEQLKTKLRYKVS